MSLKFQNKTNVPLVLAIGYWDYRCSSKRRKEGWWTLAPGETATVWIGNATNKYFYFYAEDTLNKGHRWHGNFPTDLPDEPFSRCMHEPGGKRYHMDRFQATAENYTMELTF
ncbi:DUF1036 domain-containing protein [Anaerobacillus sp. MEB173]|uniref:DUF1036 domain-containing protein n=1 Tax=Anaerobacillus sp. MEB173 TaxID=3383345 RepID=UPI003F931C08